MRELGPPILIFVLSTLFPIPAESQEFDRSLFKASNMVSLETAKKEMKQVYPNICDLAPKRRRTKEKKKFSNGFMPCLVQLSQVL